MSENKDKARALLQAIAARDADAMAAVLHEDVVWWTPASSPMSRPIVGRDVVISMAVGGTGVFRPDTTSWSEFAVIEEGDVVVAHVQRNSLTAKGAPYENDYVFRFDFSGGVITEAWETTDTAQARAMFAAEPPGG